MNKINVLARALRGIERQDPPDTGEGQASNTRGVSPTSAAADLDVEALREQVYYLLFIYGQMDAEHGHWAAVRRMLNIDAAYAAAREEYTNG